MVESNSIFLSYASQDAAIAGRLGAALRAAGIEVWFDQSELRGGEVWGTNPAGFTRRFEALTAGSPAEETRGQPPAPVIGARMPQLVEELPTG